MSETANLFIKVTAFGNKQCSVKPTIRAPSKQKLQVYCFIDPKSGENRIAFGGIAT